MKKNTKVSTAVIRRLPRYYRQLCELQEAGVERISSSGLGRSIGLTASQIRQDLFCFGGFGQQGYGYKVDSLKEEIGEILGISRGHTLVVLGTGNLGRAIIQNFRFSSWPPSTSTRRRWAERSPACPSTTRTGWRILFSPTRWTWGCSPCPYPPPSRWGTVWPGRG